METAGENSTGRPVAFQRWEKVTHPTGLAVGGDECLGRPRGDDDDTMRLIGRRQRILTITSTRG